MTGSAEAAPALARSQSKGYHVSQNHLATVAVSSKAITSALSGQPLSSIMSAGA